MKLILLRHGETNEEGEKIILGSLPGTLSAKGKAQAGRVAELIVAADLQPTTIISSDLDRASDYAMLIGKELSLNTELEPLVRERNAGSMEGKMESEIDWDLYEKIAKPLRKHSGGESFEDVRIRVKKFLKKTDQMTNPAILVSHSAFLAVLMTEVCGWTLDQALGQDFRKPLVIDTKTGRAESLLPS